MAGDDDLRALASSVRDALARRHPLSGGGNVASGTEGWQTLVDLGITGLGVPEDQGGSGGGLAEQAVALTEAARVLLPAPLLASVVALPLAPAPLRAHIATGEARVTVAWRPDLVLDLRKATDVLLVEGSSVSHVTGFGVTERSTVDVTRPLDALVLDGATVVPVEGADLAAARLALTVGVAAEAVGVAEVCLDLALEHARVREAFGRPIGAYQAVSHPLVEAFTDVSLARATVQRAAASADPADAAAAVVTATAAAAATAERTIQVLGGVGFTWEHVAHRLYKRALGLLQLAGPRHEQLEVVAAAVLD